jgi:HSP20 family protein
MTLVNFNNRTRSSAPYFNNVFDSLFTEALNKNHTVTKMPPVNISEDAESYKIEVAAPGLNKEDFQINVKKDTLSLWVEKKAVEGEAKKDFNRREFDFSSFARSFMLPETVDAEKIAAEYTNGVLYITIGKKDESLNAPKTISVS